MYSYGIEYGDVVIAFTFTSKCLKVVIPNGGMPFYSKRHRKLYVCDKIRTIYIALYVIDLLISVTYIWTTWSMTSKIDGV